MDSKLIKWPLSQNFLDKHLNTRTMISLSTSSLKKFSHSYLMLIRISNTSLPHLSKHITLLILRHLLSTKTPHAMIVYTIKAIIEIQLQLWRRAVNSWDYPNVNQLLKNRDLVRNQRHIMLINAYHFLQNSLLRKFNLLTKRKEHKKLNISNKHFLINLQATLQSHFRKSKIKY